MHSKPDSERIGHALDRYRVRSACFDAIAARRPPHDPVAVAAPAELSSRELDVLRLAAEGYTAEAAAAALVLTEHTIKSHFKRILVKLGARNRTHAVAVGIRSGLIP